MVAAGNVSDEEELQQITDLARTTIAHYLSTVAETNNTVPDTTFEQNYYAQNQKCNPHTPRVMVSLGLSEEDVQHVYTGLPVPRDTINNCMRAFELILKEDPEQISQIQQGVQKLPA
jgi:hypothetical protein